MNPDDILRIIAKHAHDVIPELAARQLQRSDTLLDLGANSIDRADIMMATMESLDLEVPRVDLFGTRNIGELVDLFYAKSQAR